MDGWVLISIIKPVTSYTGHLNSVAQPWRPVSLVKNVHLLTGNHLLTSWAFSQVTEDYQGVAIWSVGLRREKEFGLFNSLVSVFQN